MILGEGRNFIYGKEKDTVLKIYGSVMRAFHYTLLSLLSLRGGGDKPQLLSLPCGQFIFDHFRQCY